MSRHNLPTLMASLAIIAPFSGQSALAQSAAAQRPPVSAPAAKSIATIVVPEWKSGDGKTIVKLRARAVHDFYQVDTNLAGTINDSVTDGDALRAFRIGLDGQFSPKIKFRADANLTDSQVNWVDVYLGYTGTQYEFYAGQHRQSTTIETVGPDVNYPLTETSLVNTSFGQGARSFGVAGRVKGTNWQTIAGVYSGNLNAGDMFGEDALQYAQVRSTFAARNKDRDVLHFGGSLRLRDAREGALLRYSTRAAATNFGPRALDTGAIGSSDTTLSVEGLLIRGPFMLMGEYQTLNAQTRLGDASLNGGYVEGTWWLTGENRRYQAATGTVGQIRPKRPLGANGFGALALAGRIEHLDQSNAIFGTRAGSVNAYTIGLSWIPIEFVMFRLATSQTEIDRALASQSGTTRVIMGRAQIAF